MNESEAVVRPAELDLPTPVPSEGGKKRNVAGLVALLTFFALAAGAVVYSLRDSAFAGPAGKTFTESFLTLQKRLAEEIFLNPWFYVVIAVVILLERLIPAKEGQGTLAKGMRTDLLWVGVKLGINAWFLPIWIILLRYLYDKHLGFLTIQSVADWPWLARLILALLVTDFVFYVTHFLRHKITWLWYFHAVHHSQKELNFFTEYRVHPIDDIFVYTIGFIPLFMVEHSFVTLVAIVWIRHWHTRMCHSNIRTDFGWLRYIFVTPQSHRVHHSIEPRHFDKNFGLTLSIWDYLFGTQYRKYDEYPDTGIDDHDFPFEQNPGRLGYLGSVFGQFLYPFRAILRKG